MGAGVSASCLALSSTRLVNSADEPLLSLGGEVGFSGPLEALSGVFDKFRSRGSSFGVLERFLNFKFHLGRFDFSSLASGGGSLTRADILVSVEATSGDFFISLNVSKSLLVVCLSSPPKYSYGGGALSGRMASVFDTGRASCRAPGFGSESTSSRKFCSWDFRTFSLRSSTVMRTLLVRLFKRLLWARLCDLLPPVVGLSSSALQSLTGSLATHISMT